MATAQPAINNILGQILDEYGARISIDGGSTILTSDANVASAIASATKDVSTPYGPTITIVSRGEQGGVDTSRVDSNNVNVQPVDQLKMDFFSHAVFAVQSEDPKFVLQGLKHMLYALRPKGVAIVISLKQHSMQRTEAEGGGFTVALEDKIKFQSKGKIEKLTDVIEYAGFERGKIRSFERSADVDGTKVDAEVVLALYVYYWLHSFPLPQMKHVLTVITNTVRKWDQLTA